jgi:anti-sigma regulatory factor (Ser/Thr protein kinase)
VEVIQEYSSIRLELQSLPACVTLVRAMLSGVGERFELDHELIDDLKTAVSEACNNVVIHAYPDRPGPLAVELEIDRDELRIAVLDSGRGISHVSATTDRMGVGLAVISALADRAEFQSAPEGGTAVRMSFGARGRPIPVHGAVPGEWNARAAALLDGEVTLSVAPVALLGDVLGRVSRAIAAAAQFSLDRFSDLYLVTDEISAHVRASAATSDIACALTGRSGRLEMAIGPFRDGTVSALADTEARTPYSFAKLVDELAVEPLDDGELMRVVVVDRR